MEFLTWKSVRFYLNFINKKYWNLINTGCVYHIIICALVTSLSNLGQMPQFHGEMYLAYKYCCLYTSCKRQLRWTVTMPWFEPMPPASCKQCTDEPNELDIHISQDNRLLETPDCL